MTYCYCQTEVPAHQLFNGLAHQLSVDSPVHSFALCGSQRWSPLLICLAAVALKGKCEGASKQQTCERGRIQARGGVKLTCLAMWWGTLGGKWNTHKE